MPQLLRLGTVDQNKLPSDKYAYLNPFHQTMSEHLKNKQQFRNETIKKWIDFKKLDFSSQNIHLIGIRREQDNFFMQGLASKDFFVLLINGKVFYFWGSTTPKSKASEKGYPFLLEGQH